METRVSHPGYVLEPGIAVARVRRCGERGAPELCMPRGAASVIGSFCTKQLRVGLRSEVLLTLCI